MPKSTRSFLVDVNVWLAIAYELHVHHELAADWFESIGAEQAVFCRLTQLGFLRLITSPTVMGADVMGQSKAWQVFDALAGDARVRFMAEPEEIERYFRQLTRGHQPATNLWVDAYLAAMAKTGGLAVVTLDRGFGKIPGIEALILSSV